MQPSHDSVARRFSLREPDGEAFVDYELEAGSAVVVHTFVPPAWRGRGVAQKLLDALIAWAEAERLPVDSRCSYATAHLARRRPAPGAAETADGAPPTRAP